MREMASIARRADGRWRARYRDVAGHEHARHFTRKADAQRWLDEVTAAVVTGAYVDPRSGRIPLRDYAEQWLSSQVVRPTTSLAYERVLRRHVLPQLGGRHLADIRPGDVQRLLVARSIRYWARALRRP